MRLTLALTAAVLSQVVLVAPQASAATLTSQERIAVLTDLGSADAGTTGRFGIVLRSPDGSEQTIVAASDTTDVAELATSSDGSHLIYRQTTYTGVGADRTPVTNAIIVTDAAGGNPHTLLSEPASTTSYASEPALSPDGSYAVWTRTIVAEDGTGGPSLEVAPTSGSGAAVSGSDGLSAPHFLTDAILIASTDGDVATIARSGGTTHAVTGLPVGDTNDTAFTVSPQHDRVAWLRRTGTPGDYPVIREVDVAALTIATDGTVTLGTSIGFGSGSFAHTPSFDRAGTHVLYAAQYDTDDYESYDVYTALASGSGDPVRVATADESEQAVGSLYAPNTAAPSVTASATALNVGQASTLTVKGLPGKSVQLLAYSRPSTTYAVVRGGVIASDGRLVFSVAPRTNTRLYASTDGGSSAPVVISVRPAESLKGRAGGRTGVFTGQIVPGHGGVTVRLFTVKAGRLTLVGTAKTNAHGAWSYSRAFAASGPVTFIAQTLSDLTNLSGQSNRVTVTFP